MRCEGRKASSLLRNCARSNIWTLRDRVLAHKQDLFLHLQERWKDLFDAEFDLLLYDLTSTYVEGESEQNPKAKYGYSRAGGRIASRW